VLLNRFIPSVIFPTILLINLADPESASAQGIRRPEIKLPELLEKPLKEPFRKNEPVEKPLERIEPPPSDVEVLLRSGQEEQARAKIAEEVLKGVDSLRDTQRLPSPIVMQVHARTDAVHSLFLSSRSQSLVELEKIDLSESEVADILARNATAELKKQTGPKIEIELLTGKVKFNRTFGAGEGRGGVKVKLGEIDFFKVVKTIAKSYVACFVATKVSANVERGQNSVEKNPVEKNAVEKNAVEKCLDAVLKLAKVLILKEILGLPENQPIAGAAEKGD